MCVAYQPSSNKIEKLEWLENFENLLADVYLKWKGVFIITGDFNIDLLGEPKGSTRRYKNLLHTFSLHQHITKATRNNKTLIDHISSNMNNKLLHTDVLMTDEISDHDTPYRIFNIKKERDEPRYKYVRNEKDDNMNDYLVDFKLLPTSIVFGFDDPNDKSKLITDCIADHASINKVKFTRPPAPWMKDPQLITAKKHLQHLRNLKNANGTESNELSDYRKSKVRYKKLIKTTKGSFLHKELSSKTPKEVWDAVNPITNPPKNRIRQSTSDLNNYFTALASNLSGKENEPLHESEILQLLNRVPDSNAFTINYTTYDEVQKIILNLSFLNLSFLNCPHNKHLH